MFHLILGLLFGGFGMFLLVNRERIPQRQAARGISRPRVPMAWTVLGGLLVLVGLLWLITAFV